MKTIIVLRCEGRQEGDFCLCRGVENIILDLEQVRTEENYILLLDYLDLTIKIFEGPCFNSNIIINALYKFYELGFFDESKYKVIQYYCSIHKVCGLILEAKPKEVLDE